jgi:hypothetical protein
MCNHQPYQNILSYKKFGLLTVITEYSLSKKPLAIERALSECIRSETHSKAGFRLPQGLACSNLDQAPSNDLLSH